VKRTIFSSLMFLLIAILSAGCQVIAYSERSTPSISTQEISDPTQIPTMEPGIVLTPTQVPAVTLPPTPTEGTGSISGRLGYPSEFIPALHIVAFLVGTDTYFTVDTELNQADYQLDGLADGNYHVVAYTLASESFPAGLSGGYTQAVICGMQEGCADHSLVDVIVNAGQVVENVDLIDWLIPLPPSPTTGEPVLGAITGQLSYPSEFIPPMRIVAFRVVDNQTFFVDTQMHDATYVLPVPAGTYHVIAYVDGVESDPTSMAGGYSQAVPSGLSVDCLDHSLIEVKVQQGSVTAGIDPGDFYAPESTFPPAP
jgi:hypothetical protein